MTPPEEQCLEILDLLGSNDPEVLRRAARLAADVGCLQAVPLLAGLLTSRNLGVQEVADRSLRKLGGRETVRAVTPLLMSEDAPARNLAMDILREIGNQDFNFLTELFASPDDDLRIFVADILGSTGNPEAVAPLCHALIEDPEVNVRYQAAVSLGDLASPLAAECLKNAMADDEWVRFAVIEALAKIGDEQSVRALAGALTESSDLVASMIVDSLADMGDATAARELLTLLPGAPEALGGKMARAVASIMSPEELSSLPGESRALLKNHLAAALSDEDSQVQATAVRGLAALGGDEAAAALVAYAGHLDPLRDQDLMDLTVESLADIGLTDSIKEFVLSETSRGPVWISNKAVIRAMGRMEDAGPTLVCAYEAKCMENQEELCGEIMQSLKGMSGPEVKEFFLQMLTSEIDPENLVPSLAYLAGSPKAGDSGEQAETDERILALLVHPENSVKEAALEAALAVGGNRAKERFASFLGHGEPVMRMMGLYALGRMDPEGYFEDFARALEDETPDVRKMALEAAAEASIDEERLMRFLAPCLRDEVEEIRTSAAEILGSITHPESVGLLRRCLEDPADWVRVRAIEGLAGREPDLAAPLVAPLLADASMLVAMAAVKALEAIGTKASRQSLAQAAEKNGENSGTEIVQAAREALARLDKNRN